MQVRVLAAGRKLEQTEVYRTMASNSAGRLFQRSTASARAFINCSRSNQTASNIGGLAFSGSAPPASRLPRHRNTFFSTRLPVELGCGESLMPLHSATASSLLKSMLSSKVGNWGCLSEGFATPL